MENKELWAEYKRKPSPAIKKQIIARYSNLVHYVIHNSKFINLNVVEEKDFFQFGIEGLSEAIDRFDPDYGTKFETYAIQRIRGKIIDELRKLQIKPRNNYDEYGNLRYTNVSLDMTHDGEDGYSLHDVISSSEPRPEEVVTKNEQKDLLIAAIKELPERDRLIISLYYYENLNYKEIAEILNITVSRVSQIHTKVMQSLKSKLLKKIGA
jgi:RNA polymerase sigma factor for flagellar operon FliA